MKIIKLRIQLSKPPTQRERKIRFGIGKFLKKLREAGWADKNNCALKNFKISQEGHTENNEYYIEWTATLIDGEPKPFKDTL